jgi:hypothetical protein
MYPLDDQARSINPEGDQLDARIVAALERAPQVRIPEGFAARIASQVPSAVGLPDARPFAIRYGRAAVALCMVLCAAAMVLLAPRATGHAIFWMSLEWMLCAQFCLLAAWWGMWLAEDRVLAIDPEPAI